MKFVCAMIIVLAPLAAADTPAQPAAKPKPAVRAKAAPKTEIPVGAVKAADGAWRYTDPAGKKWIYRKTPFGIARIEDDGQPVAVESASALSVPPAATRTEGPVKAVEEGDTVRFERPGPFGTYRWDRKKSELTEAERAWLEASRKNAPRKPEQE